ncbi:MAG TPA: hypothetical protein PK082_05490 [Phycisphaerae bacterium]|mgnify:CR=1 FL=1|nr:hypothetical protein [Phycisphaerae bacterium]
MAGALNMPETSKMRGELTGFDPPLEEGVTPTNRRRTPASEWIDDELLDYTRRVWSKAYGRVVSTDEALEMLMNVKRLAETIVAIRKRRRSGQ